MHQSAEPVNSSCNINAPVVLLRIPDIEQVNKLLCCWKKLWDVRSQVSPGMIFFIDLNVCIVDFKWKSRIRAIFMFLSRMG